MRTSPPRRKRRLQEMVAVTGRVVATGSDPFVILVIVTGANEQYELVGERTDRYGICSNCR